MTNGTVYETSWEADDMFAFAILDTNTVDRYALSTYSVTAERKVKFVSSINQNATFTVVHIK